MPELPEVEALTRFIAEKATGTTVQRAELASLAALKTYQPPIDDLVGRIVVGTERRGKYLLVDTGGLWLVTHLARGGWVQWREKTPPARARPGKGPLALRLGLSTGSGLDVTEQGTEKRLALWVVTSPDEVDGVARLGPDPLAASFGVESLRTVLSGRGANLKNLLVDQSVLAGVGNAYSDEALHRARLSPFRTAGKLNDSEVQRLHAALIGVLSDAVGRSAGMPAKGLKAEKRSGMAVHGRAGEACPVCGDTVREVSFSTKSLQYCPTCQTGGKLLADRRLSRLLR
ncbi:MAG: Fpg/Nei family DNA glycosylase [Actinomycetota bacterium]|nr:Fpg/Nei family DNA glycosylase [Actinomycetota bacterium]